MICYVYPSLHNSSFIYITTCMKVLSYLGFFSSVCLIWILIVYCIDYVQPARPGKKKNKGPYCFL
ncbi:hypothetical protein PHAVU_007G116200 [Phaseolus vulgaris]|uniref:Uncharacterized protein n=1 Tax=Phaseolus vulgaris TaxID=3885 RepID=V7BDM8_PHAVU|nr:hypothetical protein PHAVU_007G116200g [Phaseolus vulgaris]ESW15944.1 hypothetical protein PHAVU_007G116200g [Phaseolus vulgaris]